VNDPSGEADTDINPVTEVCGVNDPSGEADSDRNAVTDA